MNVGFKIILGIGLAAVVGLAGFSALAFKPAIAPIQPPPPTAFPPELVAKGEVLASAGYCSNCHTAKGGQPLAGGYAMETGFGTIYSTNISPDGGTGIGSWSEAAFSRAMHEGVSRNGSHLLPAFPYDHFARLNDDDTRALYAYLMTRPAVHAPARENEMPFPLNLRFLQAGWKLLFFHSGRYENVATKSAEWNRGAYLVDGISHCGACHTPRNLLGAERQSARFAGADIDGWTAPALTSASVAPVAWTAEEFNDYLREGISRYHGSATGPMGPVVRGLDAMPDADIKAMAVYLADIGGGNAGHEQVEETVKIALATDKPTSSLSQSSGERLYASACAACHYNSGSDVNALRPDMAVNSAVSLDDPTNLAHIILDGVSADEGKRGIAMPGFRGAFTDEQIAGLMAYLRESRTAKQPWSNLTQRVSSVRSGKREQ